jgi:2-phospho-L-lactate guanylyltransferase
MIDDVFVVPIKSFDVAKERLRLGGVHNVTSLARELALGVLQSCAPRHVIVLSESSDVTSFAQEHSVEVFESTASNLNEAAQGAYEHLSPRFRRLIIVHGDLRHPEGLANFVPEEGVTVVTDHLGLGTNVLVVPTGVDFHFLYGANSALLHQQEAQRLGLDCHFITDSQWRFDVDEPSDLNRP